MTGETLAFTKGHGTENDFVLILDEAGAHDMSAPLVAALCDRRAGIGADGILRAVRAGAIPDGAGFPPEMWFMDYRNADGSTAEMCGNGARVFVAYLEREMGEDAGSAAGLKIATRAGVRTVRNLGSGRYSVGMGRWALPAGGHTDALVEIAGLGPARPAYSVDVGNPHAVVMVADRPELDAADLTHPPAVEPVPPLGTNVEIVVPPESTAGDRGRISMRVHERGVGETRSCGTGACAAAIATMVWAGEGAPSVWDVEVPGGALVVRIDGVLVTLEGPAVLVADGLADLPSLIRA